MIRLREYRSWSGGTSSTTGSSTFSLNLAGKYTNGPRSGPKATMLAVTGK